MLKKLKQSDYPLEIIEDLGNQLPRQNSKQLKRFAIFKCQCGNIFRAQIYTVKKKQSLSCGCIQKQRASVASKTHGLSHTGLYHVWHNMIDRCYNKNNKKFNLYGEKGITVDRAWKENFKAFYNWAKENGYEPHLTIDKDFLCREKNINPPIYSPTTCIWVNKNVQSQATIKIRKTNKSGYRGVCWVKSRDKFKVQICINNKHKFLAYTDIALHGAKIYDKYIIDNNLKHTINGVLNE